jgi:hypothetical protein
MQLYAPGDVPEAYDSWNATCGPAALAAVLRRPLAATRALLPGYRGFTTPTLMRKAVELAGGGTKPTPCAGQGRRGKRLPEYGLAFLQFSGGWWEGNPEKVQYKFTHWLGAATRPGGRPLVYDINAGAWLPAAAWKADVLPSLLADNKGKGAWVRAAYEVTLPECGS